MASSLKQDFDANLSCPLCKKNFVGDNIPKDLDCSHVCCEVCLNNMPKETGLKCPLCGKITNGGVAALRTNLLARNLAETLNNHKKVDGNTKICSRHTDQEALFYCKTCKRTICQYCIIQEHSKHLYEPIPSLVRSQKQKIGRALRKTKVHIEICERYDKNINENQEKLSAKFQKAETKIAERVEACVKEINAEGHCLKKKLNEMRKNTLENGQRQKESNQCRLQKKRDVIEEAQSCLDKASDYEYIVIHEQLFGKLKVLIEDDTSSVARASTTGGFKLEDKEWSVSLGLNLIPEQFLGRSYNDQPSTSYSNGGEPMSEPGTSDQEVTSTSRKRIKLEKDEEEKTQPLGASNISNPLPTQTPENEQVATQDQCQSTGDTQSTDDQEVFAQPAIPVTRPSSRAARCVTSPPDKRYRGPDKRPVRAPRCYTPSTFE